MAAIRVMLGKMPAMLRGILEETFAAQNDIMLVGLPDARPSLSEMVTDHDPQVLIVGVERTDWVTGFAELFVDHPNLRILAIGDDGRSAMMQELYIRRWRVADLSPRSIVAAVRESLEPRDGSTDIPASGGRA